ncbi:MAG: NnrU family protein [Pseudomonadota bacterium]
MAVFILSHVLLVRARLKEYLIRSVGARLYLIGYSVFSVILFGWVIAELLNAPRVPVWYAGSWAHAFAVLMMLPAFVLIGIGIVTPNPVSVAFRAGCFRADRPGFVGWFRHPLLLGLTLWGAAHVPANGDWPSLILFAGSAVFGAFGMVMLERRYRRKLGAREWDRLTSGAGHVDRAGIVGTMVGIVAWCALLALHPILFGVDPLAFIRMR